MQECFISSIFNLQSLFLFDEFGDWFGDVIVWRLAFERYLIFWSAFWSLSWKVRHLFKIWWCWWWKLTSLSRLYFIGPCKVETVQDFLIKFDIKPLMHLLEISIYSLHNDLVRLTKIMNNLVKDLKILSKIGWIFPKKIRWRIFD